MSEYTELKRLAEHHLSLGQAYTVAKPSVLLALIAENERLKTLRSVTERDLAQELEVWRHGPSCWNCGDTGDVHDMVGEWLGQCDCNAAKLIDISSERDELRAEIAGLRTGYEAYERVNAELKDEVELLRSLLGQSALAATTLRTDAEAYANHSGFNRGFVDFIRSISGVEVGHGYGSSKYPQQADVVAALGQGEQS